MKLYLIMSKRKHGNTWAAVDLEPSEFIAQSTASNMEYENRERFYRVVEIEVPRVETDEESEARLGKF